MNEEERRYRVLTKLNKHKHIGVIKGGELEESDFDYFYENGWQLISFCNSYLQGSEYYFKKVSKK